MDATTIALISGLITAIGSIILSGLTRRDAATKTTVDALQSTVGVLRTEINAHQAQNERLLKKVNILENELSEMRQAKETAERAKDGLQARVLQLEEKVKLLEDELNQWRTGEKKKTGPLESG